MRSRKSLVDILGTALGIAAIVLVAFSLIYLLGLRPMRRVTRGWWGPWNMERGGWGWESEEATEEVQGRFDNLSVSNISGPVAVEGWDEDYIQVHYVKQARNREALERFPIEIDKDGDTLKIRPAYPPTPGSMFGSVSFDIKIPSSLKGIKINNVSGGIALRNLAADIDQELETISGSIESERSANLRAKSTSGSIDFSFAGSSLYAHSISGRIDGKIRNLEADGSIDIETVSGSVQMEAFPALDASLRLQSVSGSISCDFPVSITEKRQHRLEGRIGAGSADVYIKTVSGSIRLGRVD